MLYIEFTLWMVYSGVAGGGLTGVPFRISQRLAYSSDGGGSWCDHGELVAAEEIPGGICPPGFAGPCHFNHEVASLVYVPAAEPDRRWKYFWFMVTATPDNNYPLSWHMLREAATPAELVAAPDRKIFAGENYKNPGIAGWIDMWPSAGSVEVTLSELHPDLADCINFTEMGTELVGDALYMSLVCTGSPGSFRVALFRSTDPTVQRWEYLGAMLAPAVAGQVFPGAASVSATDLFLRADNTLRLVVSPVEGGLYAGCGVFPFSDPAAALLADADLDTLPDLELRIERPAGSSHAGMCTFATASTVAGMLFAQQFSTIPQIRLLATGQVF